MKVARAVDNGFWSRSLGRSLESKGLCDEIKIKELDSVEQMKPNRKWKALTEQVKNKFMLKKFTRSASECSRGDESNKFICTWEVSFARVFKKKVPEINF